MSSNGIGAAVESVTVTTVETTGTAVVMGLGIIMRIKHNASQEYIGALQPGLYIIAGKKVLVK